jgi:DNA mismatch repair protein MutS2
VPFSVSQKTLDRLEWPEVVERLRRHARTPRGRSRCEADDSLFEEELAEARARLAETSEARAILDAGSLPPLAGVRDQARVLGRLRKGGMLTGEELLRLGSTLRAIHESSRFLLHRSEEAPRLAEWANHLVDHSDLEAEIDGALEADGEVRDSASADLAAARRESRQIAGDVQRRIAGCLQDPDIVEALSDSFFTIRNDRYVLPVRADARGRVAGIVHDASSTGTTLFVEPQAVVDLNNRLKQAELTIERETRRVLRALTGRAAQAREAIESNLELLEIIDLAFARGELSKEMDAVEPVLGEDGVYRLHQLRHPLLPLAEAVPNDLHLGESFTVLVLSGPNAGGKTVTLKALGLTALFARAGLHVPAAPGAKMDAVESILADIGDEQDIRESLSTFSAHMANLSSIVESAGERSLVALDEVGVGTDPGEGAALGQAVLEALADARARVVATTHFNLLKEMAAVDSRFANASVEFDSETLAPTYRLTMGAPGASSATAVAARMGMRHDILERANTLLEREDRRLDRMLAELAASRLTLERERSEATRLREESETVRDQYRSKLERLQVRRDKLFEEMRGDLDRSFREAHAQVAGVIRDLQRGGRAQDAAHARERLIALEEKARVAEAELGAGDEEAEATSRIDWTRAKPGDPVLVPGGRRGTLRSLPDRRGRVSVRIGNARLELPSDRIATPSTEGTKRREPRVAVQTVPREASGGATRCDLRGLRVDEALDRVTSALDDAATSGSNRLVIVHGLGTGALRKAIRQHLRDSPYVVRFEAADPREGGDGVTIALLED